jgi:hypothetical protein
MTVYDIDSGSLPAVKNLRSKFERLASGTSPSTDVAPTGNERLLVTTSPRRRSSNPQLNDGPVSDAGHIRTSSSSSDFQTLARRAPPPPPQRSPKPTGPSPKLSSPVSSPGPRSLPMPSPRPELMDLDTLPKVSALRSKL